jgi:proline iminopeptidase
MNRALQLRTIDCAHLRHRFAALIAVIFALALFLTPLRACAHDEHGTTFDASSGATIYYEVFGSGDATPLFVANGGPGMGHRYLHVSDAWDTLGQNRKIVMWDQRGTGHSAPLKPGQSCTLADQINDLDALRAHLGYDKIDLLGHSWGGFLAMAYAARFPQHIERLIILDSIGPRLRDTHPLLRDVFPEVVPQLESYEFIMDLGGKDSDAADASWQRLYYSTLFYSTEHRDEYFAKMGNDTEYNRNVSHLVIDDIQRFDLNAEIAKFRFPVLAACGRFDVDSPPLVAYTIHKAIPGSQLVIFEKSGHMPFFEVPEKFVSVVNAFLSGGPVSTSR